MQFSLGRISPAWPFQNWESYPSLETVVPVTVMHSWRTPVWF